MTSIPVIENISIEDLHRDPYPIYAHLRKEAPVALIAATGRVFLTKGKDVRFAKEQSGIFTSEDVTTPAERAFRATTLMRRDGDVHRSERRAMMPGLSAAKIKTVWAENANIFADDLLSNLEKDQKIDLFTAIAGPFAGAVLGKALGLEGASPEDLVRWSQILIDAAGNVSGDEAVFQRSDVVNEEIDDLIDRNISRLKTNPDESVLSAMIAAGSALERTRCNIKIAIGGGVNEPRDGLLSAVFCLLNDASQLAAVKNEPALFGKVFEEAIRWVAPIQTSPRKTLAPVTLSGVDLPVGTRISTIQASANRDEDLYENAETFDIFRREKSHFSFGHGAHFCMGTHLSRMSIAQIMLPRLFQAFPDMKLAAPVPWYGFTFRGPLSLEVNL